MMLSYAWSDKPILYVEDCLLTGTEVISLLRSMLGKVPPGRKAKTPPLDDPNRLRARSIEMRFAVIGNFGAERVGTYCQDEELRALSVATPRDGLRSILTEAGIVACRSGKFLTMSQTPFVTLARLLSPMRSMTFTSGATRQGSNAPSTSAQRSADSSLQVTLPAKDGNGVSRESSKRLSGSVHVGSHLLSHIRSRSRACHCCGLKAT